MPSLSSHFYIYTILFIFIWTFLISFSEESFAQNSISYTFFRDVRGISQEEKEKRYTISLRNGKVDLSDFLNNAKRILQSSNYENGDFIHRILNIIKESSSDLCQLTTNEQIKTTCVEDVENSILEAQNQFLDQQSRRILYPENYTRIGVGYQEFERIKERLSSHCPSQNISNFRAILILRDGSPAQYEEMLNMICKNQRDCLQEVFDRLVRLIANLKIPSDCYRRSDHPICQKIISDYAIRERRLIALATQINPSNDAIFDVCSIRSGGFSRLQDYIDSLENDIMCSDYTIGETRNVRVRGNDYVVTKESDKNYTIPLSLSFHPADDYDGQVTENQVHSHYFNRVKGCIDRINPRLFHPHDGSRLHLEILDANAQNSRCMRNIRISIQSSEGRSNSISYAANVDCPVIVHEVLHLLGLEDEYRERTRGQYVDVNGNVISRESPTVNNITYALKYDCRVVQENSIMASHRERYHNTNSESSILDPAHFNAILYGQCHHREDVKLYRECSQLAYQTSIQNGGEHDCSDQKERCERSNVLGRNKSEILSIERENLQYFKEELRIFKSMLEEDPNSDPKLRFHISRTERAIADQEERIRHIEAWP